MEARQADAAGYISPPWAGTFIEAKANNERFSTQRFPYLSVGTFIEAAGSSRLAREIPQLSLQFL